MTERRPETAIGEAVATYLAVDGWDLYHEVAVRSGGGRCDLVGVKGGRVLAVECKARLSWDVIDQAVRWMDAADVVAVAVDRMPRGSQKTVSRVLKSAGIALMICGEGDAIDLPHGLPIRGRRSGCLLAALSDEHKIYARAGSNGGYASPWAITCRKLREWVAEHPGRPIREAMSAIKHHYHDDATGARNMRQWIKAERVAAVFIDDYGDLFPTQEGGVHFVDEERWEAAAAERRRRRARDRAIRRGEIDLFASTHPKETP